MGVLDKFMSMMGLGEEVEEEVIEEREEYPEERAEWRNRKARNVVIPFNNSNRESWQVFVSEPVVFDDCQQIADHLKSKRSVIINLESVEISLARRIIDFVGGVTYALDGKMQKVGAGMFIAAPANTEITGDILSLSQTKDKDIMSFITKITEANDGK
ncbi:MAG: cell division protein SepF [Peptococcaceae bacterium]|jgi:cell division inhibitor SepF|nr:cell division protein SepF [Peptococcaceae bacterium]